MPGNEAEVSLVLKAKNLASREVDKLGGSFSNLGGTLKTVAKVGVLGLAGAVVGLGAGLIEATKRAAEEELGVKRLDAALRANVEGFNGNTGAIEKVIAQREALAFSDDELRSSLTFLVTKYGDVTKAQNVQATAMDVARLKNISLDEATALVTKGMDGNAKVLKQLGIQLPKTATEQERLAAIQTKSAGQAKAYGKTAAGAQQSFQIALDDLVEDAGSGFLPIMQRMFVILREKVIPAVRDIIQRVQKWYQQNKPLITQIVNFVGGVLGTLIEVIGNVIGRLADIAKWISKNRTIMNILRTAFAAIATAVGMVVGGLRTLVRWAEKAIDALSNIRLPDLGGFLPDFHTGGTIPGPRGEARLVVGHGGERVVSPGAGTGGGHGGGRPVEVRVVLDGRVIGRVMDERLYYAVQSAAPTALGG